MAAGERVADEAGEGGLEEDGELGGGGDGGADERAGGEDEGRPGREWVDAGRTVAEEKGGAEADAADTAAQERLCEGIDRPAAGGEVDAEQAPEVAVHELLGSTLPRVVGHQRRGISGALAAVDRSRRLKPPATSAKPAEAGSPPPTAASPARRICRSSRAPLTPAPRRRARPLRRAPRTTGRAVVGGRWRRGTRALPGACRC